VNFGVAEMPDGTPQSPGASAFAPSSVFRGRGPPAPQRPLPVGVLLPAGAALSHGGLKPGVVISQTAPAKTNDEGEVVETFAPTLVPLTASDPSALAAAQAAKAAAQAEAEVKELLNLEKQALELEKQMRFIDEKIHNAKRKKNDSNQGQPPPAKKKEPAADGATGEGSGAAPADPRPSVQDHAPEENKNMRREVAKRQKELNELRRRWFGYKGKTGYGFDGMAPGQAETTARLLLQKPPAAQKDVGIAEESDSSDDSEFADFGRASSKTLPPASATTRLGQVRKSVRMAPEDLAERRRSEQGPLDPRRMSSAGNHIFAAMEVEKAEGLFRDITVEERRNSLKKMLGMGQEGGAETNSMEDSPQRTSATRRSEQEAKPTRPSRILIQDDDDEAGLGEDEGAAAAAQNGSPSSRPRKSVTATATSMLRRATTATMGLAAINERGGA